MEGGELQFQTGEEEPSQPTDKRVKVRCSVFFDGTLNNRTNTDARRNGSSAYSRHSDSDSYENDYSNIAKMEREILDSEGFDATIPVYMEGAGTTDEAGDSSVGYALGKGTTGVKAKVREGIIQVMQKIQKKVGQESIIESLVFDVFGFSRGAAAARFFIYELLSEAPVYVGRHVIPAQPIHNRLELAGYTINPANIKIRFVGLYDTVASEGFSHSNDTYSLKLDAIGRAEVEEVVQLASADEHRKNFSLTNIKSAGAKGKEVYLPGVHSDIGGGYREEVDEDSIVNKSRSKAALEADKQRLVDWGYYLRSDLTIEQKNQSASPRRPGSRVYIMKAKRKGIRHHYDRVPLLIMVGFARKAGITIDSEIETFNSVSRLPSSVYSDLKAYADGRGLDAGIWMTSHPYSWLRLIRRGYAHFSAHMTPTYGVLMPHEPNFDQGMRKRAVHDG